MTEIDLTALMEAIDAADKVVALKKRIREDIEKNIEITLRSAIQDEAIATAEAEGLHRALFLVSPQHDTAQPASPASEAKPVEKSPREKCADMILEDYEGKPIPESIDDLPAVYHACNTRTLRAALNLAHQKRPNKSRAALSETPPAIPPADSESVGAGPSDEMPEFLRRSKAAAE